MSATVVETDNPLEKALDKDSGSGADGMAGPSTVVGAEDWDQRNNSKLRRRRPAKPTNHFDSGNPNDSAKPPRMSAWFWLNHTVRGKAARNMIIGSLVAAAVAAATVLTLGAFGIAAGLATVSASAIGYTGIGVSGAMATATFLGGCGFFGAFMGFLTRLGIINGKCGLKGRDEQQYKAVSKKDPGQEQHPGQEQLSSVYHAERRGSRVRFVEADGPSDAGAVDPDHPAPPPPVLVNKPKGPPPGEADTDTDTEVPDGLDGEGSPVIGAVVLQPVHAGAQQRRSSHANGDTVLMNDG